VVAKAAETAVVVVEIVAAVASTTAMPHAVITDAVQRPANLCYIELSPFKSGLYGLGVAADIQTISPSMVQMG
jgi:hypothetical protein